MRKTQLIQNKAFIKNISEMIRMITIFLLILYVSSCEKERPEPDLTKFYPNQRILKDYFANTIAFESDGTAWIGTSKQGLIKYSTTETIIYDSLNSVVQNVPIWDIAIDSEDNVWIGNEGLVKYDGKNFTRYSTTNSDIPEDVIWSIAIDSKDHVWFSSSRHQRGGLVKYNGSVFEVFTPTNSDLPANQVDDIAIDNNDNVWLTAFESTIETSLVKMTNNQWIIYPGYDFGDPPFIFDDIAIDSRNRIIVLYNNHFATPHQFFEPQGFIFDGVNIDYFNLDSTFIFKSVMIDHNDIIWCTHNTGYAVYDEENWTVVDSSIFEESSVFSIEQANDGNIWIGTGKGIQIIEGI